MAVSGSEGRPSMCCSQSTGQKGCSFDPLRGTHTEFYVKRISELQHPKVYCVHRQRTSLKFNFSHDSYAFDLHCPFYKSYSCVTALDSHARLLTLHVFMKINSIIILHTAADPVTRVYVDVQKRFIPKKSTVDIYHGISFF